jgi:hypothetical protein
VLQATTRLGKGVIRSSDPPGSSYRLHTVDNRERHDINHNTAHQDTGNREQAGIETQRTNRGLDAIQIENKAEGRERAQVTVIEIQPNIAEASSEQNIED